MTYVPNHCPDCGASLDPGESCDCGSIDILTTDAAAPLDEAPTSE